MEKTLSEADVEVLTRIEKELRRRNPPVGEGVWRVAWEVAYGPVPDNTIVIADCHNDVCFNPTHLRLLHLQKGI